MIPCTDFIPCYSELFTFIENKYGRTEVDRFWRYLFEPTDSGIPLINFVRKEGIRGCYSYWTVTLNEEAADFTMYLNEKAGWFQIIMHRCPSKGRLLELQEKNGIKPYHDYCLHCDCYRFAAEQVGLKYICNFTGIDHAACSIFIYDPNVFDGRVIIDEETQIMDRKASQNEYFHRDFHSSMNMGVDYLGEKYGEQAVLEFLKTYTQHVHQKLLNEIDAHGLAAIEAYIQEIYKKERASDAVMTQRSNEALSVEISYCPAVRHLNQTGRTVSVWYPYTTTVVMEMLAERAGCRFLMESYAPQTGAAKYRFMKE